jgi:flavin reductase (DIM6/NTAB) family NADH-FMN oxidoreductase RutF
LGRVNAAPFGNVTSVSTDPERLVLATMRAWDTYRNIRATKEFVVNVPGKQLLDEVWICGDKYAGVPIPYGINELKIAKLTETKSLKVRPPRITECFGHLECKALWIKNVGDHSLILADIVAASGDSDAFDKNWVENVEHTMPLMQVSGSHFAYPSKTLSVNTERVTRHMKRALNRYVGKVR